MFPHDYESAQANAGHLVEEEKGIGGEGGGEGGEEGRGEEDQEEKEGMEKGEERKRRGGTTNT